MSLEWIEGVPADWLVSESQFVLDYQKRGVQEDDEIVTAFRDGQVTLRKNRRTDGFTMADKEIGYQHVCEGDLVVHSMDGGFGAIGVSDSCGKSSPVVHAYTSTSCDLRFISYQLRSAVKAGWIAALAKGIRVRSTQFDRPALASLKIAYPSLEAQQRIADYLDRETAEIDAAVADLDRYVELLESRQQVLISNVVNGITGPITGAKDIPEAPLGTLLSSPITDGPHTTPEFLSEGVPFLSVDGIQRGELVFEGCRYISQEDHEEFSKKTLPQKGDILMGKAASTGKIALVRDSFEFSIWSPLAVIRTNDRINSEFLAYALKSSAVQVQIDHLCSFNTQKNIAMRDIPRIRVPFPSKEGQLKAVDYLNREVVQVNALLEESTKLRDLLLKRRSVLITDVVTGRKQV